MKKFFDSNFGQIFISIVWGLGLAVIFRRVCEGRNCILIKAENPVKVQKKIYKYENSCYKYYPEPISCQNDKLEKISV